MCACPSGMMLILFSFILEFVCPFTLLYCEFLEDKDDAIFIYFLFFTFLFLKIWYH